MLRFWIAIAVSSCFVCEAQIVDGKVWDARTGADIPGVIVSLRQKDAVGDTAPEFYGTETGTYGRFHLENVKDGTYVITYRRKGYWPPKALGEEEETVRVSAAAGPLRLAAKMEPAPALAGRVLDASGNPVPNAKVWVIWHTGSCSEAGCYLALPGLTSGAEGEFSFTGLPFPGTYLVAAMPPATLEAPPAIEGQRFAWVDTYYPNAGSPQLATPIDLRPGSVPPRVDIKLASARAFGVSGSASDDRGEPVPALSLKLDNGFGASIDFETDAAGAFELASVPKGRWRLTARRKRGDIVLWSTQTIEVKDRDVEGVRTRISPPFTLSGKIMFARPDGVPPPAGHMPVIYLSPDLGGFGTGNGPPVDMGGVPNEAGNFAMPVYPGLYRFTIVDPAPAGYYLDTIRLGGVEASLGGDVLSQDTPPVTVVYRYGGGTVRGHVEGGAGSQVFLVPKDLAMRKPQFIRNAICGPHGEFEVAYVRPGEYRAVALPAGAPEPRSRVGGDDIADREGVAVVVTDHELSSLDLRIVR